MNVLSSMEGNIHFLKALLCCSREKKLFRTIQDLHLNIFEMQERDTTNTRVSDKDMIAKLCNVDQNT